MTIREKLEVMLVAHGLYPDEAKVVMEGLVAGYMDEAMQGRWDDDDADYPDAVFQVLWMAAKGEAVKWIDANKPKHFARQLLT